MSVHAVTLAVGDWPRPADRFPGGSALASGCASPVPAAPATSSPEDGRRTTTSSPTAFRIAPADSRAGLRGFRSRSQRAGGSPASDVSAATSRRGRIPGSTVATTWFRSWCSARPPVCGGSPLQHGVGVTTAHCDIRRPQFVRHRYQTNDWAAFSRQPHSPIEFRSGVEPRACAARACGTFAFGDIPDHRRQRKRASRRRVAGAAGPPAHWAILLYDRQATSTGELPPAALPTARLVLPRLQTAT